MCPYCRILAHIYMHTVPKESGSYQIEKEQKIIAKICVIYTKNRKLNVSLMCA